MDFFILILLYYHSLSHQSGFPSKFTFKGVKNTLKTSTGP